MIRFSMDFGIPFCQKTETLYICSPASAVDVSVVDAALTGLNHLGLKYIVDENSTARRGMLAGSDEERLAALIRAVDSADPGLVMCTRGGYGVQRITDMFLEKCGKSNFIIIGYSDITYLQSRLVLERNIKSIHGPMLVDFNRRDKYLSVKMLIELLRGVDIDPQINNFLSLHGHVVRTGTATGILFGGNLTLLENLVGVSHPQSDKNYILFLEEIGEKVYRVDRSLQHMKSSGFLKQVRGVIIGEMTDIGEGSVPFGMSVEEIVADLFDENVPIISGFPTGHGSNNFPLVIGSHVNLDVR